MVRVKVVNNEADLRAISSKLKEGKKRTLDIKLNKPVKHENYKELNSVIEKCSGFKSVSVRHYFSRGIDLRGFLEALSKNSDKKAYPLDITDNEYADCCTSSLVALIRKKSLSALKLPDNVPEQDLDRILTEIKESSREMKFLKISKGPILDTSIGIPQHLLKNGKILDLLDLSDCILTDEKKTLLLRSRKTRLFKNFHICSHNLGQG
uniref:uncharacterized protein LOC120340396 n=1 Tax=Styela clava TaxID=7725 RepID=UPI001939C9AE|nr:uncharacterized protein LOC120340396 [Styela clava]